jgi:hypothetical protein
VRASPYRRPQPRRAANPLTLKIFRNDRTRRVREEERGVDERLGAVCVNKRKGFGALLIMHNRISAGHWRNAKIEQKRREDRPNGV